MSPIPGSSPNSTARTSHMAQCIHITPRAYILPFLLLLLCHHLPLWVFWAALSPPTTNYEDACDRTFSQWISQTFVLHLAIPVTCIVSIIVTFLSPIHRPLANHRTCFSETPLIVAVFLLYVALASWDAYGIHRSRRCFPASLHHRGGILAFDLTVSILVLLAWIASMCSASPLSEADMRAKFTSRLRCLTYAFVCRRYDNDDETTDMFSFLAESMAQFFYVRRRDHVPRIDISHPLVSKSTYLYVGDAPAASRCPLRPPSRGQASERQLLAPRSPSAVMTDVSPSIYVVRAHSASRHGPRDDVSFVCYAGVTHTSVQYISGANELFKVPFSVCRDDVKKEVVVAIRGSFSWHDVLTDALGRTMSTKRKDKVMVHMFNDMLLYSDVVSADTFHARRVVDFRSSACRVDETVPSSYVNLFGADALECGFMDKQAWVSAIGSLIAHTQATTTSPAVDNAAAVVWIPDSVAEECSQCGKPFRLLWRRHHCRRCGFVVCGHCSEHRSILFDNDPRPVRVCTTCHNVLTKVKECALLWLGCVIEFKKRKLLRRDRKNK
ncbi:hypothetical protein DYB26_002174, partial [Aphanomyces astaci]